MVIVSIGAFIGGEGGENLTRFFRVDLSIWIIGNKILKFEGAYIGEGWFDFVVLGQL